MSVFMQTEERNGLFNFDSSDADFVSHREDEHRSVAVQTFIGESMRENEILNKSEDIRE